MNGNSTNTDEYLKTLPEWQQNNLALFRKLVHKVSPEVAEEIKWGVPVFLLNGKLVFAMSAFKSHTKYNFIGNGAKLNDTDNLFNNGLESNKSRGIDLTQDQTIDNKALEALIKQAITQL